jgi:hypothetical protein
MILLLEELGPAPNSPPRKSKSQKWRTCLPTDSDSKNQNAAERKATSDRSVPIPSSRTRPNMSCLRPPTLKNPNRAKATGRITQEIKGSPPASVKPGLHPRSRTRKTVAEGGSSKKEMWVDTNSPNPIRRAEIKRTTHAQRNAGSRNQSVPSEEKGPSETLTTLGKEIED